MIDTIKEYIVNEKIAALYDIYHSKSVDSDALPELQDVLVQLSQEKMHTKIVDKEHFNWDLPDEQYVLRVLYELALAHYEEGMTYEALCEFELLSVLSAYEPFSTAMKKHLFALDQELEYDDFVNAWLDHEDDTTFFMKAFDVDFEKQFADHLEMIDQKLEKTKKLFI